MGMSLIVEENVTLNPGDVGFLSMNRIVLEPDGDLLPENWVKLYVRVLSSTGGPP
jgi:hypothetical protein